MDFPHKEPVTRKMIPFDDFIVDFDGVIRAMQINLFAL